MNSKSDQQSILSYLNSHFNHFEAPLKQVLSETCIIKTFKADEPLMQTGQYFKSTMLIVDGSVKLYRESDDGSEYFIYYLGPGNACALSMICAAKNEKSLIMAKAVEDTTALMVPITMMDQLMQQYKSWYYFVLETYRTRFEELLEVIDSIAFKGMDERLEFYLKGESKKQHSRELSITHQQIADDLNSSREVISRLLKKMEQRGIIRPGRNTITLL